jgi:hypothetical protein
MTRWKVLTHSWLKQMHSSLVSWGLLKFMLMIFSISIGYIALVFLIASV